MLVPTAVVDIVAGDQLPVIPLLSESGKVLAVVFWQKGPNAVKSGTTSASMLISMVPAIVHP